MFQEQMVLAREGDEAGSGNARGQLAAGFDWNHEVAPHMHDKCRGLHFGEKMGDIEIAHDIEISGSALGRGGSALQLVENIRLLVRSPWNEQPRKHLPEARIVRAPSEA